MEQCPSWEIILKREYKMKEESWDIQQNDSRTPDTTIVFIIFCEDAVSEPIYFRSFQNENVKVNAIPNQRKGKLNLMATVQQCVSDGLIIFDDGYRLADGVTENIWCVYDRDFENTDLSLVKPEHNVEWDISIQTALSAGLKIAWSNDAFELWVLLHFEDITPGQAMHRNFVYERLTEIFKVIQPRTAALDEITTHQMFNYKYGFKTNQNFITFVLPILKQNTQQALERAKKLTDGYNSGHPFHERNPCTMVYQLTQALNNAR